MTLRTYTVHILCVCVSTTHPLLRKAQVDLILPLLDTPPRRDVRRLHSIHKNRWRDMHAPHTVVLRGKFHRECHGRPYHYFFPPRAHFSPTLPRAAGTIMSHGTQWHTLQCTMTHFFPRIMRQIALEPSTNLNLSILEYSQVVNRSLLRLLGINILV